MLSNQSSAFQNILGSTEALLAGYNVFSSGLVDRYGQGEEVHRWTAGESTMVFNCCVE